MRSMTVNSCYRPYAGLSIVSCCGRTESILETEERTLIMIKVGICVS